MKKVGKVLLIVGYIAIGIFITGIGGKVINNHKQKVQITQDSITKLNRLWQQERQQNINTIMLLDSISRTGDSTLYVNTKGVYFILKLTPKK
jgi:hypothetical protein